MTNSYQRQILCEDQRQLSRLERTIGPRPILTLVVEDLLVREIWVGGRAPLIRIRDYDWGTTDPMAAIDPDGFAYSPIRWNGPAWALGLSLQPPLKIA